MISDAIIERAVELWARALRRPTFDNGDKSFVGVIGMSMLAKIAENKTPDDIDEKINDFARNLTNHLKFLRDHAGELTGEQGKRGPVRYYFPHSINVDYRPDAALSAAAATAGVPVELFPIKSNVYLHKDYVSASFGYGVEAVNHYPLGEDLWLITTLSGDDMKIIIPLVQQGRLPELSVEEPKNARS